ncbi:hypothetical protein M0R88_09670 [Halorussus gelatinilyticus]|uniref:Uncharacterized protein n=1 Tax=Halorussus gelatinilyticus TaxID=2937524 RepID=A0A8U0IDL5_9EURY|nr:hypothetical protein [Halorussus gelatinilyticus]UPV98800.1 hypothetical protein M0R88_09670 [Halorussus gelatinilyticus]
MSRVRSAAHLRAAGLAGAAGGVGWALLSAATFAAGRGVSPLGYGFLDALTPVAFALAAVGVAGYRVGSASERSVVTSAGFGAVFAGLVGACVGSAAYVGLGRPDGWTVSVWAYLLALVGAPVWGVGLLRDGTPPRSGAALLAAMPAGVAASFGLAALVGDETLLSVGTAVWFGGALAALCGWIWRRSGERTRSEQ